MAPPLEVAHGGRRSLGRSSFFFAGRLERGDELRVPLRPELAVAHLRQVHGTRLVEAANGSCGEADALFTDEPRLALCIQTADCVPVLLVADSRVVAIHAGWRGIAGRIVGKTLATLHGDLAYRAVVGPAIGPCCYEVGDEVADQVQKALPSDGAVDRRAGAKSHLDLQAALVEQLSEHGVQTTEWVRTCTKCSPELWSYRGDGPRAGRNLSFVWLEGAERS